MPFDISDPNVQNVLVERESIDPEDVEEVTRDRRNFMVFLEGQSREKFIGASLRERAFDAEELERVVDTEINELV